MGNPVPGDRRSCKREVGGSSPPVGSGSAGQRKRHSPTIVDWGGVRLGSSEREIPALLVVVLEGRLVGSGDGAVVILHDACGGKGSAGPSRLQAAQADLAVSCGGFACVGE